jgi:hypothetical protein
MAAETRVRSDQRFTRNNPCPVCGGWNTMRRGHGSRCWGYASDDGQYAHCVRPEYAGRLDPNGGGAYAHRLAGGCRCGVDHGFTRSARVGELVSADRDSSARDPHSQAALAIWGRSRRADGTLVATYLASRRLTGPIPPSLRYVPELKHRSGAYLPAMIAAVTVWPARHPIGIQRTWMRRDGGAKADVESNKMSLGPNAGGAVRLGPVGAELVVAEGVETALTVQQEIGKPAWAVLGVRNMRNLVLPDLPLAALVVIAADNDPDGLLWANLAAQRWLVEGRRVRMMIPPAGMDFNDVLLADA